MIDADSSGTSTSDYISGLLYELLDAHVDTIRMAHELDDDPAWAAHLDYLRDLQRVGREALAQTSHHWSKVARVIAWTMKDLGSEFPGLPDVFYAGRIKDLAAQVPAQAAGCTRLKAYLAEAIAALREHLAFVQEIEANDRALAMQTARIDLGGEGKQLLKYQTTQERSYQAALRRLDAGQNSGRVGPGRPPKKSAAQVETTAPKAPAQPNHNTPRPTPGRRRSTTSEATMATARARNLKAVIPATFHRANHQRATGFAS